MLSGYLKAAHPFSQEHNRIMRRLLTNARIIDGTGTPMREGEVMLEDDRIAEVGEVSLTPDEVLDVGGRVVAPGFIDIHSHSDFALPHDPLGTAKVLQGVTTEVVGNCGIGMCPGNDRVQQMYASFSPLLFGEYTNTPTSHSLDDFRARLESQGISQHAAMLIPHGNLRCAVMGLEERDSTTAEREAMREMLEDNMRQGAFGVSTGLVYPPGAFADLSELIDVAKGARDYGGIYATHMRNEGSKLEDSVHEAIAVGEQAEISVQISHHKAAGRPNWGKVKKTLRMIDEARARGVCVHSDVYPYTAGSTALAAMALPLWAFEGSHEQLMQRLRDPATRERMIADAKERLLKYVELPKVLRVVPKSIMLRIILRALAHAIVVNSAPRDHSVEGKRLSELSKERGSGLFETIVSLLEEQDVAVMAIAHIMSEQDVRAVMQHSASLIGSDGLPLRQGKPHPRTWGTFPRVLRHYVGKSGLFTLEEAVARMTSRTAEKLGLGDRGVLAPGKVADLVVFDAQTVEDRATYEEPRQPPVGMPHVFVAGQWTVREGEHTGARAGKVLHRQHTH